jgi:hypothetical protein
MVFLLHVPPILKAAISESKGGSTCRKYAHKLLSEGEAVIFCINSQIDIYNQVN